MVGTQDDCFSDASAAVLQQAGFLQLRSIACNAIDLTSPQITSIDYGLLLSPKGLGTVAAKYKTASYIGYNVAQSKILENTYAASVKAAGGTIDHLVEYDPTTVDLTAQVSTAIQGNPGALAISSGQAQTGSAVKAAAQLGYKGKVIIGATQMDATTLASLGSAANNIIAVAPLAPIAAPNASKLVPAIREYNKQMAAAGAPATPTGFEAWLTVYQFRDVAAQASTISRAGLLKALKKLTNWSYKGSNLPINFAKPGPYPGYPNARTHWIAELTVKNGQWVWNGKWIDIAPGH
jgi:ABC-type branched-subunit amino acid transport system substrate-binding protein